ncbi:MAG: ABC transporter permease [Bacteroidota bacterium]
MRKIVFIIEKEFKQIFRNKIMVILIFAMPVIQLLILSYAADFEVKGINIFIDDMDSSPVSKNLISSIKNTRQFEVVGVSNYDDGLKLIEKNKADVIISIPDKFGRDITTGNTVKTAIVVDAINGSKAGVTLNYLQIILNQFVKDQLSAKYRLDQKFGIEIINRNWFNPTLNYKIFMVPGILVLLVTMISLFLSSMNIVREKELGTIEQLNVTPIKKYEFVLGKLLPFVVLGLVEFSIGILIAKLWFNIPIEGNMCTIYLFTLVYLTLVLGMGMFISTLTETQQQALFIAWFFSVIFILMSGLFTPIESMPVWAQKIADFNPIKYYVDVIRLVMLKGSTFLNVSKQFGIIVVYSIALNVFAIMNYRKTSG